MENSIIHLTNPAEAWNNASPARVILEQDVFKDRSHRDPSLRSRMTRWEGRNVRKRRREGFRAEENAKELH